MGGLLPDSGKNPPKEGERADPPLPSLWRRGLGLTVPSQPAPMI
jgi:hypothetical protein